MFSIYLTLYNQRILKISVTTQSQHGRKEPLSSSATPYYLIIHVGTNNALHSSSYEFFQEMQSLRNLILKYLPSARITISTPALRADKANANDINKAFTELVKESNLDYISHENIKESHINEYGLHINKTGSSILAKNLISGIRNF